MIADVLTKHNVPYTDSGQDYLIRCINPEHEDNNPSMRVNKETGVFHCFACKFRGNILRHFGEPMDKLAIARNKVQKKVEEKIRETKEVPRPNDHVPYIGPWRDISAKTMAKFKAFYSSDYPDRLLFPIFNAANKRIAYIGRSLSEETIPKYKIYPSGVKLPLYPIAKPKRGRVIVVEGIVDALNLQDKGLENVTAVFGARILTDKEIELLKFQGTTSIDILYDSDEAGDAAANKLGEKLTKMKINWRRIRIQQEGADPGSLSKSQIDDIKRKFYD